MRGLTLFAWTPPPPPLPSLPVPRKDELQLRGDGVQTHGRHAGADGEFHGAARPQPHPVQGQLPGRQSGDARGAEGGGGRQRVREDYAHAAVSTQGRPDLWRRGRRLCLYLQLAPTVTYSPLL